MRRLDHQLVWRDWSILITTCSSTCLYYLTSQSFLEHNPDSNLLLFSFSNLQHLEPARNIDIPSSAYNGTAGSYTFQLSLATQLTFLIVLSDSTGFGSLGTTEKLTVNTGQSSCDTSTPSTAFNIAYNSTNLQQCRDFTFDGFSAASKVRNSASN